MRAAVEQGGHTSADGPFSAQAAELLPRGDRRQRRPAHHLVHRGAGDERPCSSTSGPATPSSCRPSGSSPPRWPSCVRARRSCSATSTSAPSASTPAHLAELMDDTVRAVVPIHYAGVGCDLDGIQAVLDGWPRAELVEDNAHGLFGRASGRAARGASDASRRSASTRRRTSSAVRAARSSSTDDADVDRAHVLYHKGTNRRAFLHGQVDKYSWQDVGSSFGLSDVLAAFLYGQLEQRTSILAQAPRGVRPLPAAARARAPSATASACPTCPTDCEQAYHMFYVLLPDEATRNRALASLHEHGVHATFHYVPLHSSPGGRRFAARTTECPVTDDISGACCGCPSTRTSPTPTPSVSWPSSWATLRP